MESPVSIGPYGCGMEYVGTFIPEQHWIVISIDGCSWIYLKFLYQYGNDRLWLNMLMLMSER